ncbi:MAG TPA: FkbM family methyltransferase [Pyrinomonadaceae bacterium]|jgi:FkbM family methyltransferase|nr:FkbM family methyltransferase [Pyrinomonadaceae bacterium]
MRPGWQLTCHPAAYRCAYHLQINDPEQVSEFDNFIDNSVEGMVLFDIGAHFGLFSLATLHYGGPRSKVIAVDPSPVAVRFLKIQSRLNDMREGIEVVHAAVSDHCGSKPMVSVGVLSSGFYISPSKDHTGSELTSTRTTTLDQLVKEFELSPTHIKIDVEGDEFAVISGGRQTLSQPNAPLLFVELHNEMIRQNGGAPQETLALLKSLGYETFATDGRALDDGSILEKPLIRIVARKN